MKLTTFFISKTKQIYAKILTALEIVFEIKAMLPWIFCLRQQLFSRLRNIFKTANTNTLIKAIL